MLKGSLDEKNPKFFMKNKTYPVMSWLLRSFKFGNGSRMSNEKLVILEFKYLQKKKKLKTSCKATMLGKLTEMEQNWIMFTPLPFYQKSSVTHLRDSHMKFTGRNKVSNTTWAKLHGLIGQKPAKQFSVSSRRKCLC